MPASLDWTAAGGIDAVVLLAETIGIADARRRLRLSDAHYASLRQVISRRKRRGVIVTAAPVTAPIIQPSVTSAVTNQPVTLTVAQALMPQPVTVLSQPSIVTASQALAAAMADDSSASRLAGSRFARKVLEHVADLPPDEAVGATRSAKESVDIAAKVHSWDAGNGAGARISIYSSQVAIVESSLSEAGED